MTSKSVNVTFDFGGVATATNLAAPVNPTDAVRKVDLDSAIQGTAWKNACRVAPPGNTNLAAPGASLDGVNLNVGDRVLVMNQTNAAENGIYVWNGAALPMARAVDANTMLELEQAIATVEEGSSRGVSFRQTQVNFALGTDPVLWTSFGQATPPATETTPGAIPIATQAKTNAGTDDGSAVTPLKLAASPWAKKKGAANIGDGTATQFVISHNFGTRDVVVAIYRNVTPYDEVLADVELTDANNVTVRFAAAPAANQFRVVVVG